MTETPDNIGDMATRVAYVQHLINKAGFGEHARTFNRYGGIRGLTAEIDALRAEISDLLPRMDADAMTITNLARQNKAWEERCLDAEAANDALRAENERLHDNWSVAEAQIGPLRAENERLREECRLAAELQIRTGTLADEYQAENERLRAALETHHTDEAGLILEWCSRCDWHLANTKRA